MIPAHMSNERPMSVNVSEFAPGVLPTGRLSHLVRAASGLGNVPESWAEYVAETEHGFPNEGEFRLFPLVAENLGPAIDVPRAIWLTEATGWAKARSKRIREAQKLFEPIVAESGIRIVWTKGTALANRVYCRHHLRPSGDLDAICNWNDLPEISKLAAREGWEQKAGKVGTGRERRYIEKEFGWTLPGNIGIDLSWMPRPTFVFDNFLIDRIMADAAQTPGPVSYAGADWLLIEAIEHGLMANKIWPIRWLVDAIEIIRTNTINWEFILEVALRYKIEAIIFCGLETITKFYPGVPQNVLDTLARHSPEPFAIDEFRARVSVEDLRENTLTNRRYNLMRRAPDRIYRQITSSPLALDGGQSLRLRGGIALRNLRVGLRWPLGVRLPKIS